MGRSRYKLPDGRAQDGFVAEPRTGIHHTAVVGRHPEQREWIDDRSRPYWPPKIHWSALVQPFVTVDGGTERPTAIGARTLVMAHVHIGHDCHVGDDVEIAPHATLGGHAEIADGAKVGIGALILPFRKVGACAVIGAGAVVTRDVPAGATVAGNPAKQVERNPVPFTQRAPVAPPPTPGLGRPETQGGRHAPKPVGPSPMQAEVRGG